MAMAVFLGAVATALAQTDNFNYTAPPLAIGWQTSISSNYPGLLTSPPDRFGGQALRMQTTNQVPLPPNLFGGSDSQNSGRIIAWRTNQTYTNFYIAVDLLGWETSTSRDTNGVLYGLIARATNNSSSFDYDPRIPVGRMDGLVLALNINRFGGIPQGSRGVVNIAFLTDGGSILADVALQGEFTVNPGHGYRLVFTGTNLLNEFNVKTNDVFTGRVYDLEDLTRPLASVSCSEPSGRGWAQSGYSGVFAIANNLTSSTDVTYDNFVAAEYPPTAPTSVTLPATPYGLAGVPVVKDRLPGSWTNFYPAAGGISFSATTLNANTITNVQLSLNGVDVTSSLVITGPTTNRSVTFSGLTTNAVYDASIVLANNLGQKITNNWTFDTFSDAYLASAGARNIEVEDIDINGFYLDNPLASGYPYPITYAKHLANAAPPWPGALNPFPNGYVNATSVNAKTNGGVGDYNDQETVYQAAEADYRNVAGFGTSQGCEDTVRYGFDGFGYSVTFDTQRKKYSDVDADLQEYFVRRNQGGDWYNYTRGFFYSTNYYNVYLRHGCDLTQKWQLGQMTPGGTSVPTATNVLGTFYLTNAFARSNFRYARLLDSSGKLAVVNLSGTNTLRLLMNELQEERVTRSAMLNYLAFVPALLVESSSQANTGYTIDTTASVEPGTRQITIPQSGSARFYRLRWDHAVTITSVKLAGGNVQLTYQ